jgi:hypothetical protein
VSSASPYTLEMRHSVIESSGLSPPSQVHTVAIGTAMGQACMLLASGHHGKRFMLPHTIGALPACIPLFRRSKKEDLLCEL